MKPVMTHRELFKAFNIRASAVFVEFFFGVLCYLEKGRILYGFVLSI